MDFGKFQHRFGGFSWTEKDSNYLDVRLIVFKKGDNKQFPLVQSLTMGDVEVNQFMRLRNNLVIAANNFVREENLTLMLIPTMPKDLDEQLELAHKVVDVVDRANRKICVTLMRYNVNKPESSYAQVRLFARKKKVEMFQQFVYVKYKLQEFIYLLDVMNSVYDKVITNQLVITLQCSIKSTFLCLLFIIFLPIFKSELVGALEKKETSFSS